LEPLLFYGQYPVELDRKSRMVIPAPLRHCIDPERDGKNFYLLVGQNRRPWLYPELVYAKLRSQEKQDAIPGIEQSDYDLMALAMADKVDADAQGRILIPAHTFEWTGIQKEQPLTLLGVRDHLELWDRNDWEAKRKELLERSVEVAQRARQARQDQ
jgi:MraZ protein